MLVEMNCYTVTECATIQKKFRNLLSKSNTKMYLFININQLDALNFIIGLFQASTCFEHICSSSGGQKLYYTVSGIITLKQVSGLKLLNSAGFVIPDGCIILTQFYLGVLVLVYLICLFCIKNVISYLNSLLYLTILLRRLQGTRPFLSTVSSKQREVS